MAGRKKLNKVFRYELRYGAAIPDQPFWYKRKRKKEEKKKEREREEKKDKNK